MKYCFLYAILFSVFITNDLLAQSPSLEFASGGASTIASGPTLANQVVTLQRNTNNPTGNTFTTQTPAKTVTFSLTNQQRTSTASPGVGVMFGGGISTSSAGAGPESLYPVINYLGGANASHFRSFGGSATPGSEGISTSTNRGVEIYPSTRPLHESNAPLPAAGSSVIYQMADLVLTFNTPVSNPILHFSGLGNIVNVGYMPICSEFVLISPGLTLTRLSGSPEFSIVNGTEIRNSAPTFHANTGSGGSSGSVQVNGTDISTLTFRIYLKAQGQGNINWSYNPNTNSGDGFIVSVSLSGIRPSGTVYRDNNGNTTIDGGGTGGGTWNTANSLYVNAIASNGNVLTTALVDATGLFTFPSGNFITGDVVKFQLSKNQGVEGQPAPAKELPAGWATVGESFTSGPNDGTADGEFTVTLGAADLANNTVYRFGVTPSADIQVNKSGPLSVVPNGSLTYKIYVTNNGPANATNVVITDPAVSNFTVTSIACEAGPGNGGSASCPASVTIAGLQGAGLTIPSLPNGSAVVFTVTGTAGTSGTITNTATATATLDSDLSNNTSIVTTRIENNASCAQSTYTLNVAQTVANNTIAVNGGTLNLYYTRTSGAAIPGVAEPLIVPVTYSDLNNKSGIDNQWREIRVDNGDLILGIDTSNGGTGSVYNSLPSLNTRISPTYYTYPFPGNISLDRAYTEFLRTGELEQLGTFTLNIALPSSLPSGVKIIDETFNVQGWNASNLQNGGTQLYSGYGLKPLIQHAPALGSPAATSFTLNSEFELGQNYVWRYLAYRASGRGVTENHRGVVFKNTNTITLTYNCCDAGTAAPAINSATNYDNVNSSYNIPCGASTANLSGLTASNKPATTTLTWHTGTPATNANKITDVTALTGTTKYYASFFDAANTCYSPTNEIVVYAPICANNDDFTGTPVTQGVETILPSIFGNDTYNGVTITTATSGNISFNYSVWTTGNATVNPANGIVTVPATTLPGTYTYTYQITDTDPDAAVGTNTSFASVTFRVVSCVNPPAGGTPDSYTKTGISSLEGFGNGWPGNVPNGFIAIESKNQGFVITRVANTGVITSPTEGMLVYDLSNSPPCVKLYNGSSWNCLARDCN
ncbi:hypothetical protein ACI6PS_00635 [Flavobacterium sp. PLA-1-15]|uniref:hypothetical protein n=1 Tax=Flavobacterium sp. PLA-1-15 TaxID=3380533 RepID=UPI003B7D4842